MKSLLSVSVICCLLPNLAPAELRMVPEPTLLEVWLDQTGSRVIRSEEVGHIESANARAVINTVVIENPQNNPSRVRGIQIDLSNENSTDRIYIEENDLVYLKRDLDGMNCNAATMRKESEAPYQVRGIARCRPSQTIPQAYCPGYYIRPEWEGLGLTTFCGHRFMFPSIQPSILAEVIGQAMSEFGLDDKPPARNLIELPANELDEIVASAVRSFPMLASSPGVKVARYTDRDDKRSAWVVFWPYKRVEDIAYSRSFHCDLLDRRGKEWNCNQGKPRSYLTVPDQASAVVITGKLDREKAIALIEFAKLKLQEEPNYAEMDNWKLSSIRPPDQFLDAFEISWTDPSGAISFEIKDAPQNVEEQLELVSVSRSNESACATVGS